MRHPYREAPMTTETQQSSASEEPILYGLLLAIGLVPVAIAWAAGGGYGAEATIGGLMATGGALGLVQQARLPRGR
jgi:hypothetical protein